MRSNPASYSLQNLGIRSLARLGAFETCDAYDAAEDSIAVARQSAAGEGFQNINYFVADANSLTLPSSQYDAVWIHSAMHHFQQLEHIYSEVKQSLKPNGLMVMQEYIGPSQFRFPERQKEIANLCLGLLPVRYRTFMKESLELDAERSPLTKGAGWTLSRLMDKVKDGDLVSALRRRLHTYRAKFTGQPLVKSSIAFPSSRDVVAADPTEAVRSAEILQVVQKHFEIIERKDWGGNIFQFLLAGIAGNFTEDDPCSTSLLQMLLKIEDALIACGELESDFAYIVAR